MDTEYSIEAFITLLRAKEGNYETVIKHMAYILPTIRNSRNLQLVMAEAARSSFLFESVESVSFFIDGMYAALLHKRRISDPTISYDEFCDTVYYEASSCPVLPGLATLCALAMVKPLHPRRVNRQIIRNSNALPVELWKLGVVALSKAKFVLDLQVCELLPLQHIFPALLSLMYPDHGRFNTQSTVFIEFGSYSHLMAACLECLPQEYLYEYLTTTKTYVGAVVSEYAQSEALNSYKALFFGVSIQMQGLCSHILHDRRLPAADLAHNMLLILQLFGFVIEEVGSGVEAYEFVYNLCLDALTESNRRYANATVVDLSFNWERRNASLPVDRGALLFFLETAEKLLHTLEAEILELHVLVVAKFYLGDKSLADAQTLRPLIEASHAFMLGYLNLATNPLARNTLYSERTEKTMIAYFDEVLALFPLVLNHNQFRIAVDSVINALSFATPYESHVPGYVLDRLFQVSKATIPGVPIPTSDIAAPTTEQPPSLRSVYVAAFIRAIPQLCAQHEFKHWLGLLNTMLPAEYSEAARKESQYIRQTISDMVTNLDLSLADIGINYWFQQGSML